MYNSPIVANDLFRYQPSKDDDMKNNLTKRHIPILKIWAENVASAIFLQVNFQILAYFGANSMRFVTIHKFKTSLFEFIGDFSNDFDENS